MAGVGGILFALDVNSIQPSGLGEFYELYAIAAAVLGGCSLRGRPVAGRLRGDGDRADPRPRSRGE